MFRFRDDHPDRCFQIKYEDLTRDPEPDLRRMFAFLGEPWEPRVLRFHQIPHDHWIGLQDGKAADSRGFEPRTGAWARQPQEALHRMIHEAGPMLRRLGYHVPEIAGHQS